jgi:exopolysaccharide biosynthesis protein
VFAVNAGQFLQSLPWGWVVLNGRQYLPPSTGPLSSAVIVDETGGVHWVHGGSISERRPTNVVWAFQSYPTLLRSGEVPAPLRRSGAGIDARHRDARLAIGQLEDGRLVIAMTRFAALGGPLGMLPFGLTTPEMAAVMGALGARDAVMLDGGISAQMLVRETSGTARTWSGLRAVPLALVARRR